MKTYRVRLVSPRKPIVGLPERFEVVTDKGYSRIVRFTSLDDSIYLDEQKKTPEDRKGESIDISSRGLTLFDTNPRDKKLIELLAVAPWNSNNATKYKKGALYTMVEEGALEKDKVNKSLQSVDAINSIIALDAAQRLQASFALGGLNINQVQYESNLDKATNHLIRIASEDPDTIVEYIEDSHRDELEVVISALAEGVLEYGNEARSVINHDNGRQFVKSLTGKDALRDAAIKFKNFPKEADIIRKKIEAVVAGESYESDESVDYKVSKDILKEQGLTSWTHIIAEAFKKYEVLKEEFPMLKKVAAHYKFYTLSGDEVTLIYKDENGSKQGVDGAKKYLQQNRSELEQPFVNAFARHFAGK